MVEIVEYKESWPEEFQAIARVLRQGLGPLALRIDHIGSTSVPGLAAKDVIDLQITVAALDDELLKAMETMRHSHRQEYSHDHRPPGEQGPDSDWEKWLFDPPASQRTTHVHVRVNGRPNQRYPLLFRDYLRAHPATSAAYGELKRRLAGQIQDRTVYSWVKDPAVDLIYLPAEAWAAATGWQPGPSDG
jgi:GrpB-like predicted nucleotidyltransferase (UPF0157 family)